MKTNTVEETWTSNGTSDGVLPLLVEVCVIFCSATMVIFTFTDAIGFFSYLYQDNHVIRAFASSLPITFAHDYFVKLTPRTVPHELNAEQKLVQRRQ